MLDEPTSGLDPLMEQAFRAERRTRRAERGQTVFLSSHILSEVEALCDRVAILRAGGLVEVGTLAEMRHLSALSVEATFDGTPPDLARVPGVTRGRGGGQPGPLPGASARSSRCWACSPRPACTSCSAANRRWRSCSSPTTAAEPTAGGQAPHAA